jgi:hypothetical protein
MAKCCNARSDESPRPPTTPIYRLRSYLAFTCDHLSIPAAAGRMCVGRRCGDEDTLTVKPPAGRLRGDLERKPPSIWQFMPTCTAIHRNNSVLRCTYPLPAYMLARYPSATPCSLISHPRSANHSPLFHRKGSSLPWGSARNFPCTSQSLCCIAQRRVYNRRRGDALAVGGLSPERVTAA